MYLSRLFWDINGRFRLPYKDTKNLWNRQIFTAKTALLPLVFWRYFLWQLRGENQRAETALADDERILPLPRLSVTVHFIRSSLSVCLMMACSNRWWPCFADRSPESGPPSKFGDQNHVDDGSLLRSTRGERIVHSFIFIYVFSQSWPSADGPWRFLIFSVHSTVAL